MNDDKTAKVTFPISIEELQILANFLASCTSTQPVSESVGVFNLLQEIAKRDRIEPVVEAEEL